MSEIENHNISVYLTNAVSQLHYLDREFQKAKLGEFFEQEPLGSTVSALKGLEKIQQSLDKSSIEEWVGQELDVQH